MSSENNTNNISGQSRYNSTNEQTSCVVLKYHRIALLGYDIMQTSVQPYLFESQMKYLAENCNLISTDQLVEHLKENREFEENCVAVTFDGGYSDIYYTASDVLETYRVPATVFVHTANINGEAKRFWWDELEDLIVANTDTRNLNIRIGKKDYKFSLANQQDKFYTYEKLYNLLENAEPEGQEDVIEQIKEQLEFEPDEADEHRLMDKDEISELSENPLITIGGHGHNGIKICSVDKEHEFEEINTNKQILEQVTGEKIAYYSYPFNCFQPDHEHKGAEKVLENCGLEAAFGHNYGAVTIEEDNYLFDIPRIKAGNFHPFIFYRLFERFFG